jgi:hypothetical protein
MSPLLSRRPLTALAIGLFAVLPAGCVAGGYGYGYDAAPAYGLDYYGGSSYVANYGGWRSGYQVAPYHTGGYQPVYNRGAAPAAHAYRSAPASRPMPSIPTASRGPAGGHPSGGHAGGGGHSAGGNHR